MTSEEFQSLTPEEQEKYIDRRISSGLHHEKVLSYLPSQSSDDQKIGAVEVPPDDYSSSSEPPPSNSEDDPAESPQSSSPYFDGFDIQDPIELLILLDDDISAGRVQLHPWQVQFLLDFAENWYNDLNPFLALGVYPNGSGKDKYLIAPCVVWLCMRYRKSRGVITQASGVQLDNQTCTYITMLCNNANKKWGNVWRLNYRKYFCIPTESPIICYATDEPGKAEGFHPLEYGRKMVIATSENKSIPDDIDLALDKCTGYTHRIHVSTPGAERGHFYNKCTAAIDRKSIKKTSEVKGQYIRYHVTARECPHLGGERYMKRMADTLPGGENGYAYKSQVLAEFGSSDEAVVIPYKHAWRAKNNKIEWIQEDHNTGGLDLSDGGAETVLSVRNGNRQLKEIPFKFTDTEDTYKFLEDTFEENNLTHPEALIWSDCVGAGKPTLDRLRKAGWTNIRYFDSRAAAKQPKVYFRRGDEAWFEFALLLDHNEIILVDDNLLISQLSGRLYKILEGRYKLLSKIEQRSRGFLSPDRADATVYSFWNYKSKFKGVLDEENREEPLEKPEIVEEEKDTGTFTLKGMAYGRSGKIDYKRYITKHDLAEIQAEIAQYNNKLVTERDN